MHETATETPVMDQVLLDQILDLLKLHQQAATYSAVAGVVGASPRNVMKNQHGHHRCSWVVSKQTRRPTGYALADIDPHLPASVASRGVLQTPDELRDWLAALAVAD